MKAIGPFLFGGLTRHGRVVAAVILPASDRTLRRKKTFMIRKLKQLLQWERIEEERGLRDSFLRCWREAQKIDGIHGRCISMRLLASYLLDPILL
jgi:hypothetical protein